MLKKIFIGGGIVTALLIAGSAFLSNIGVIGNKAQPQQTTIPPITTSVATLPEQINDLKLKIDTIAALSQSQYDELMAKLQQIENEIAQSKK
jgi:peptidoglycan hydrolase CwlO-like protein